MTKFWKICIDHFPFIASSKLLFLKDGNILLSVFRISKIIILYNYKHWLYSVFYFYDKIGNRGEWREALEGGGYSVQDKELSLLTIGSNVDENDTGALVVKDLLRALLQIQRAVEPKYLCKPLGLYYSVNLKVVLHWHINTRVYLLLLIHWVAPSELFHCYPLNVLLSCLLIMTPGISNHVTKPQIYICIFESTCLWTKIRSGIWLLCLFYWKNNLIVLFGNLCWLCCIFDIWLKFSERNQPPPYVRFILWLDSP